MKIVPKGNRMYVVLNPVEEHQTEGGLWLPDKNSQKTRRGEVMAIGEQVTGYKAGDIILITYYSGTVLDFVGGPTVANDTHRIITDMEVLAVLEE